MVYNNLISRASSFFSKKDVKGFNIRKNIILSFFFKGLSIAISFLLIPLTINYVNATQYGIWVALSSIILWFNFFDIGLGNGLKNKLAEANALGNIEKAKTYVSTTYALLVLISTILFCGFLFINQFLSWNRILNATNYHGDNLNNVALIVVGAFCLQFIFQVFNTVLIATHSAATVSMINAIGQTVTIITIYILTQFTTGSLYKLVIAFSGVPITIQIIASIYFFCGSYKQYSPSAGFVNFYYTRELLSMGGMFFLIQIGALVLMQTDNIIVTQLFGPKQLTTYNVAYKVFSIITMAFSIIMVPFWSAFTDAYARNNFEWIDNALKRMYKIFFLFSLASCCLLCISPLVYRYWVGKDIQVPFLLSVAMCVYVISFCSVTLSCYLLNGIGKMRLQLYLYLATIIINVPLAIFLAKYWGLAGVMFSNVIIFIAMGIVFFIQSRKIVNRTATGIWNK